MAIISDKDGVTVYKFARSGLVALCHEVSDYVRRGEHEQDGVDPKRAYYREGRDGTLQVVFPNVEA